MHAAWIVGNSAKRGVTEALLAPEPNGGGYADYATAMNNITPVSLPSCVYNLNQLADILLHLLVGCNHNRLSSTEEPILFGFQVQHTNPLKPGDEDRSLSSMLQSCQVGC